MRVAQQQGLLSLFEDFQGTASQIMAIGWLELSLSKEEFEQFRQIWFNQATIAVVPNSSSGFKVESSESRQWE